MAKFILFIYITTILILSAYVFSSSINTKEIREKIFSEFMAKGTKELFKVWHFVYGKTYDYNTELGIQKYKTFKANLKKYSEHNAKNLSWKQGISHLSDMTFEEVNKFYNLSPMNVNTLASNLKRNMKAVLLDDFNDNEEEVSIRLGDRSQVDHTKIMRPVKDQGNCGSCWAFGTISTIEGNWALNKGALSGDLSTQQLVDCDTKNKGCDGGWFSNALLYFKLKKAMYEKDYPYVARKKTCAYSATKASPVIVPSFIFTKTENDNFTSLLQGPLAAALDANDDFQSYSSGVFNGACGPAVSHAVVIVGYSATDGAWIVQNSWGSGWGENGFIRIKENLSNNSSCNLGKYGYRPTF